MLNAYTLSKLYRSGSISVSNPAVSERYVGNKSNNVVATAYSREFLIGYLLHYCRLCQEMQRQGTIPVLETLLEIVPDNGEVHFLLGLQHKMNSNLHQALLSFERAAALRPDKPEYALAAVHLACVLNERNKALDIVCNVISAYPIMASAYAQRALIFEVDENWGRALRDYEMCTRLEPKNPAYLVSTARMYRMQKNYKMARWSVAKALKLESNYTKAHEELHQLPLLEQFVGFLRPDEVETAHKK